MAAQEELTKSLKKNYDRKLFAVKVLSPVFGSSMEVYSSLQRPAEQPNNTESKVIEEVGIYARCVAYIPPANSTFAIRTRLAHKAKIAKELFFITY